MAGARVYEAGELEAGCRPSAFAFARAESRTITNPCIQHERTPAARLLVQTVGWKRVRAAYLEDEFFLLSLFPDSTKQLPTETLLDGIGERRAFIHQHERRATRDLLASARAENLVGPACRRPPHQHCFFPLPNQVDLIALFQTLPVFCELGGYENFWMLECYIHQIA